MSTGLMAENRHSSAGSLLTSQSRGEKTTGRPGGHTGRTGYAAASGKKVVFCVVLVQALVTLLASAISFLLSGFDWTAARSSLLGGLLFATCNFYLTFSLFIRSDPGSAQSVVRNLYRGEAGKFALAFAGFSLIFLLVRPLDVLALLVTFAAVQAASWFAPVLLGVRLS